VSQTLGRLQLLSAGLRPLLQSDAEIKKLLSEMPASIAEKVVEIQTIKKGGRSTSSALLEIDLAKCKDVSSVCLVTNCRFDPDSEKLVCQLCLYHRHECPKGLLRGNNKDTLGTFKSDQLLKNLKASIVAHFASAAHV